MAASEAAREGEGGEREGRQSLLVLRLEREENPSLDPSHLIGSRRALAQFRVDKPLLDSQGRRLENFMRVETFGDNAGNGNNDVHWVKALVDPHSRDVFAFQAQIVPANRTAVPAPAPERPTLEARAATGSDVRAWLAVRFRDRRAGDQRDPGPVRESAGAGLLGDPARPSGGSYWVMEDNGYGAKANSADFLLRLYHLTPDFKTAKGGTGTVAVGDFLQLRDEMQGPPDAGATLAVCLQGGMTRARAAAA